MSPIGSVLLVFARLALQENAGDNEKALALTSLNSDCRIVKRWFGIVPAMPEAAWLECKGQSVLITHPTNLVNQVTIRTRAQALEYVRFFSRLDTFRLFSIGGMIEVVPEGSDLHRNQFFILKDALFAKHLQEASVRELSSHDLPGSQTNSRGPMFEIVRVALFPDNSVRLVTETVLENGFWSEVSARILEKEGSRLGLHYPFHH